MSPEMRRRPAAVAVLAAALTTGLASSASANPPTPVEAAIYNFDPGVACTFPLTVSATSGLLRSNEFNNGPKGTVRQILVGTGVSYTFENASTGATHHHQGGRVRHSHISGRRSPNRGLEWTEHRHILPVRCSRRPVHDPLSGASRLHRRSRYWHLHAGQHN